MPGIARNAGQDVAGGAIVQGSSDVYANNNPAVRVGDRIAGHGKGPHASPVMAAGSSNVFVNNKAVCRSGDSATCGHASTGSSNVFVNGAGGGGGGAPLATGAGGGGNNSLPTEGSTGYVARDGNFPSTGNPLIDALLRSGPDPNFRLEDLEPEVLERQRGLAIAVIANGGYGPDGFVCTSRDSETGALVYFRGDALYGESTWVVFPDGSRIDRIPPSVGDPYNVIRDFGYAGPTTGNYGVTDNQIEAFIIARNTTGEVAGLDPDPAATEAAKNGVPSTWTGADGVEYAAVQYPDGRILVPDAGVVVTPEGVALPA